MRRFEIIPEKYLGIGLFIALFSVLSLQILSRYIFEMSIPWTEEVSRWLYIYMVLIGSSEAVLRREHIGIDALPNILGPKGKAILSFVIHGIFLFACIMLVKLGYKSMLRMDRLEAITFDLPSSVLYFIIPFGFGITGLRSIQNMVNDVICIFSSNSSNKNQA